MLLASKWDVVFDLGYLLRGLLRFVLMDGPDWIRYPAMVLGSALVGLTVWGWWRERRGDSATTAEAAGAADTAENPLDS
ncbi:hypothetical protein ACIGO8_20200 [Streptomyces sp. NPDC053493]|uniref:hypothetical protein n=1 Tax=Streptomyces sp. NPDC053493 TaxID=3365705 RepID=UPI0037D3E1DC